MIAKLTGVVDSTGPDWLILDVNGVGYLVYASGRALSRVGSAPAPVRLLIESVVRQEQVQLFGFLEEGERHWFRVLLGVQGVGAKVALSILSALSGEDLGRAIATQDRTLITQAEGVGPKLAGRIISELKDKVAGMMGISGERERTVLTAVTSPESSPAQEAVSALTHLGYRRSEAVEAVARALQQQDAGLVTTETLIRASLPLLASSLTERSTHG